MDITKEQLAERYSKMDENSLIDLYLQDSLTEQAKEAIQAELKSRGLSLDKVALIENYEEPPPPTLRRFMAPLYPRKHKKRKRHAKYNLNLAGLFLHPLTMRNAKHQVL